MKKPKAKMSLATIQGKLTKAEMKKIMAGSGSCPGVCIDGADCHVTTSCTGCVNHWCVK